MAELVLHIGVQKTATTYVQRRFRQNRDALARLGVIYPRLRLDYDHQMLTAPWNQTKFMEPFFFPYGSAGYFDRVLSRYASGSRTLFLSSEGFYLIGESAEKMRDFKSRLAGFDRVRLILVVRAQTELIQSMWMEVCKLRTLPLEPARFVDKSITNRRAIGNPIDYGKVFHSFAEAFGAENVTVVNYARLRAAAGGPFGFFLRQLGVEARDQDFADVAASRANVSPDPLASAVFRQTFVRDTLDEAFIRRLTRVIKPDAKTRTTIFSRDQFARARAEFAPLNRAFVRAVRQTQPDFDFSIPDMPVGTMFREDLTAEIWAQVARLAADRRADRPASVRWRAFKRRLPPALTEYPRWLAGGGNTAADKPAGSARNLGRES